MVATSEKPRSARGKRTSKKTNQQVSSSNNQEDSYELPHFVDLQPFAEATSLEAGEIAQQIHKVLGQPAGRSATGVFESTREAVASWIDYHSEMMGRATAHQKREELRSLLSTENDLPTPVATPAASLNGNSNNGAMTEAEPAAEVAEVRTAAEVTEPVEETEIPFAEGVEETETTSDSDPDSDPDSDEEDTIADPPSLEMPAGIDLQAVSFLPRLKDFERSNAYEKTLSNFLSAQKWDEDQQQAALYLIATEQGKGKTFLRRIVGKYPPRNQSTVKSSVKQKAAQMAQLQPV